MFETTFLRGLTVLEVGEGIAGAGAGRILSTFGAEVMTLRETATHEQSEHNSREVRSSSMLADVLASGKRDVLLEELSGRSVDIAIIDRNNVADISLHSSIDTGVEVVVTPFGLDGPRSSWLGTDLTISAASGMLDGVRDPTTNRPLRMAGSQAYLAAAQVAALAACHALDARRSAGQRIVVDVSTQEATLAMGPVLQIAQALMECEAPTGAGRFGAPAGLFRCRDGLVHIMAMEAHQWSALTSVLGSPPWAASFETVSDRIDRADELIGLIEAELAAWDMATTERTLQEAGVPATGLYGAEDLLRSKQFTARGSLAATDVAGRSARTITSPFHFEMHTGSSAKQRTIAGLRVVEIGHVLAVPLASALLGAMGANVTKLEDPARLDMYRRNGPYVSGFAGIEGSAFFATMNHSKVSRTVTMDDPGQLAAALDRADVVIENLGPRRARKLGVDSQSVAEARDDVLGVSSSGYGHTGPAAGFRVYAYNVHSTCGVVALTDSDSGQPARVDVAWADLISGFAIATAVAAWTVGPQAPRGGSIDFSMVELAVSRINEYLAAASQSEVTLRPDNVEGVFRTVDGWIAATISSDEERDRMLETLGLERTSTDSEAGRVNPAPRADFRNVIEGVTSERSMFELEGLLQDARIPASRIATAEDLVDDPHLSARRFFRTVEHPLLGQRRLIGLPWRFVGREPFDLAPSPTLGSADSPTVGATSGRG